jgi:hypothetical protein
MVKLKVVEAGSGASAPFPLIIPMCARICNVVRTTFLAKLIFTRTGKNRLGAASGETMKINGGLIFTRTGKNRFWAASGETMQINRQLIFTQTGENRPGARVRATNANQPGLIFTRTGKNRLGTGSAETMKINLPAGRPAQVGSRSNLPPRLLPSAKSCACRPRSAIYWWHDRAIYGLCNPSEAAPQTN